MRDSIVKYASTPMLVMTKFPEPFEDLNPSFKVNIRPLGNLKGKTPTELLDLILPPFRSALKDFELVQPPTEVKVSGIPSGYARMNFVVQSPNGDAFPTTSELWIVPRGDYFFMIGAGTRQDEKTGSRREIQSIIRSVKIQK